jgi:hypothetical protein
MGIAVLLSLLMATAIAETPSHAPIPRHQLLLVPTRLRPAPTPRLAAVMAAEAVVLTAVVAEAHTCPLVEAGLVVVAAAAAAAVVAVTNPRTYGRFPKKFNRQRARFTERALRFFRCSFTATPSSVSGYIF